MFKAIGDVKNDQLAEEPFQSPNVASFVAPSMHLTNMFLRNCKESTSSYY